MIRGAQISRDPDAKPPPVKNIPLPEIRKPRQRHGFSTVNEVTRIALQAQKNQRHSTFVIS
jgi:hypothetical protein